MDLETMIRRGHDPRYYDIATVFRPDYSIQLWAAALAADNGPAFHFIIVLSNPVVYKPLLHMACRASNVRASVVAISAGIDIEYIPQADNHFIDKVIFQLDTGPRGLDLAKARRIKRGILWIYLRRAAWKRWSIIFAAVASSAMWRAFLRHALRPESSYIQKFRWGLSNK